jgi:hypothetical protein
MKRGDTNDHWGNLGTHQKHQYSNTLETLEEMEDFHLDVPWTSKIELRGY